MNICVIYITLLCMEKAKEEASEVGRTQLIHKKSQQGRKSDGGVLELRCNMNAQTVGDHVRTFALIIINDSTYIFGV